MVFMGYCGACVKNDVWATWHGQISAAFWRRTSRMSPGHIEHNMLVPMTASLA
jgi:hypothetical protein